LKIIRISTFYHDSSACLVDNGNIVSAVQEERFTRIKYDSSFPLKSIDYCLKNSNLTIEDNEKLNNLKEIDQQRSSIPAVTHLDYLVLENYVLDKKKQKKTQYSKDKTYEPD
jgi:predicted NodU family carbamoyl transferase